MKFLADENIYRPIIDYLKEKGFEVISVAGPGLSGASDEFLYNKAVEENLVIVSMDKDFLKTYHFPPNKCGGIIVVKVFQRDVEETTNIFKKQFEKLSEDRIAGNLVIITSDTVRTRIF